MSETGAEFLEYSKKGISIQLNDSEVLNLSILLKLNLDTMIRSIFLVLIVVHGLIHIMGFVKAFNLAEIEQLTLPVSRTAGLFWLLASILLLLSAVAFFIKTEWWWIVATVGFIFSQGLIITYWQDAKFGTIANIILLIGCSLGYGNWNFNKMVQQEIDHFWSEVPVQSSFINQQSVENLPSLVQQWMARSRVTGKEKIQAVHFNQTGEMKTSPEGNWLPVNAEQYVKTEVPGFLWIANVKAAPFIHLAGRDKYLDGQGHMLIKLMSLIPVADSRGEKIDQGTLLRYLAEMIWYPTAALQDYISWEQLDSQKVKATMTYGGITASGIFTFNDQGKVIGFEAQRYYDRREGATLEKWVIAIDENSYRSFEGIQVPTRVKVIWELDEGDFTWYKLEVRNLVFNKKARKTSVET